MNLVKVKLQYTDTDSADTEIKYSIVSSGLDGAELLLLIPPEDTAVIQKRIFSQAKRILKDMKQSGKIAYFATPDNFLKSDTVSQYVNAMFPRLKENLPEITTGFDFLLINLSSTK